MLGLKVFCGLIVKIEGFFIGIINKLKFYFVCNV